MTNYLILSLLLPLGIFPTPPVISLGAPPTSHAVTVGPPLEFCELLWSIPVPSSRVPTALASAFKLASKGRWKRAAATGHETIARKMGAAQRVFGTKGGKAARDFVDENMRGRGALFGVRGILLVLPLSLAAWMARVQCLAGDRTLVHQYLQAAWRDFGRREVAVNLLLVSLIFGGQDESGRVLTKEPEGWREKAAVGWYECNRGVERGMERLKQARALAPESHLRDLIGKLERKCEGKSKKKEP